MNVLLLVRHVGPTEGMVYSRLRDEGHEVFVYDVNGSWVKPSRGVPFWARAYRLRRSTLSANSFEQFIERHDVDRVIASGLEAAAFAAKTLSVPFIPLLWRGSLDFSAARTGLTEDFRRVMQASDRLLLDDEWEMDKANSKGSRLPHLRIPLPELAPTSILRRTGASNIALIHPAKMSEERIASIHEAIMATLPAASVTPLNVDFCFRARDITRNRRLQATLQARLGDCSHVVLLGSSADYSGLLVALRHDWDRIVVEDSIGSRFLCSDLGFTALGRGLNLVDLLRDLVQNEVPVAPREARQVGESAEGYLATLDACMSQQLPADFEDLDALRSDEPLNVFFSTAALEDRTNGARPQRIRNMSEAMADLGPTIRVFSGEEGFQRRVRMIEGLLARGRGAGVFYGENSTSPIVSQHVVSDLASFLRTFGEAGGRTSWFVRDLHWLEEIEGYLDRGDQRESIRQQGLAELASIAASVHVLFAPSQASGEGFNRMLDEHGVLPYKWAPLPPGVAAANTVDAATLAAVPADGITLLYSGGLNAVYGMDTYLAALAALPKDGYWFDFVIRDPERENLHRALARFGLYGDERVRISTVPLDSFLPRSERCIGVILLDSEYARLSFPYKTVSMLEFGYPILCYRDMGIADFVTSNGVGVACDRSVSSILSAIAALADGRKEAIRSTRATESWAERARVAHAV